MEARRCNIHGLIASSDGRCIICRRGDARSADAPPTPTISSTTVVFAVGGIALAALLSFWIFRPPKVRAPADDVGAVRAPPTEPTTRDDAPPATPRRLPTPSPPDPVASAAPSAGVEEPSAADARLDQAKHQVAIKMYGTSTCPYCKRARAWLARKGYRYTELDIEASETDAIEMKALNPAATTPTFTLDGSPIAGFDAASFDEALTRVAQAKLR